jgi:uncharacterized protein
VSEATQPRALTEIWPAGRPLIGMVHLMPLPGAPQWCGSMTPVLERAEADTLALTEAGFDGILVENFLDVPFFPSDVPAETVAAMTVAANRVAAVTDLPFGINVLRNDARAALGVAVATGARFVRVNVHTGSMWTDQGLIEGRAHETLRVKAALGADVAVLADVLVKHASPPAGTTLEDAARDSWHRGLADALIASGRATGLETSIDDVRAIRAAVPEAPLLVGSGTSAVNGAAFLEVADGAIVGSAVMNEGRPGTGVDPVRAAAFVKAVRS